jgi:hypothetical protein
MAKLIGKKPGTSFNKSLDEALKSLEDYGIILGWARTGNDVEAHLSESYLSMLADNPWFMPLKDIPATNMCVLALKWFLRMSSQRRRYSIGVEKLRKHLGMTVKRPWAVSKALLKACEHIPWVELEIEKVVAPEPGADTRMCRFTIRKGKATPIHSLRRQLDDSVEQAL